MIIFSVKVAGSDHLIAWDNKNKKPEPGASLMPPAEFQAWAAKAYPKTNLDQILDLVRRKGTSFPHPERDLDFCLRNYTYIKRGNKGGSLTAEEFVDLYGPKHKPFAEEPVAEEPVAEEFVAKKKTKAGKE